MQVKRLFEAFNEPFRKTLRAAAGAGAGAAGDAPGLGAHQQGAQGAGVRQGPNGQQQQATGQQQQQQQQQATGQQQQQQPEARASAAAAANQQEGLGVAEPAMSAVADHPRGVAGVVAPPGSAGAGTGAGAGAGRACLPALPPPPGTTWLPGGLPAAPVYTV